MDDYYVIIPFNIKWPNLGNNTDPEWLGYRLKIFRKYTLESLANQTDKNFKIWFLCLPESEELLGPRLEAMRSEDPRMRAMDFIFDEEASCGRLANNEESLCFLKIDSDDMYRNDTINRSKKLFRESNDISLVMFCNGFVYDTKTQNLHRFTRWSITTYAVFFPPQTFNHKNFRKYCMCDQTKVRGRFMPSIDLNRMVCCLDHERNLHSDPKRHGIERERRTGQDDNIIQKGAYEILKEFGVGP